VKNNQKMARRALSTAVALSAMVGGVALAAPAAANSGSMSCEAGLHVTANGNRIPGSPITLSAGNVSMTYRGGRTGLFSLRGDVRVGSWSTANATSSFGSCS